MTVLLIGVVQGDQIVSGQTRGRIVAVEVEEILRARQVLRRELAGLEKLVRNLAVEDPVSRLLMTMPGVGPVVALTFVSAIDDPGRFRRSKDVGPWVGLTPGRNQSGERDIVGVITKAGDAGLRTALYQAATVMLYRGGPNWLKAWALRLAVLRGRKRATVALDVHQLVSRVLDHEGGELWRLGLELVGDQAPLCGGTVGIVLGKCGCDEGGDDAPALLAGKGFRKREIARGAEHWLAPGAAVVTDGLGCWGALDEIACSHQAIRTGSGRQAARMASFKWVNTTLGNIKSAITGTYRKLGPNHAGRYLASFAWRYNRRYQLETMIPRFVHSAARTEPMPYRLLIAG